MNTINLLKVAIKALQRNKIRTFLTMLGMIIGVASVIAMLAIGQGSKSSIQEQISSLGSNVIMVRPGASMSGGGVRVAGGERHRLNLTDVEVLKQNTQYIKSVSPHVSRMGQVIYESNNWPTNIQGVSENYLDIRKMSIENGVMFTEEDIIRSAKVVVIGQTVVENLFPNGENPIGKMIRYNRIPFQVIGVLAQKGNNPMGQDEDDVILAPYTTVQKRIMATTDVQMIFASALSEEFAELATQELEQTLRLHRGLSSYEANNFRIMSQQELISTFTSASEVLTALLAAIAGISLLVGGIGIMNIMYVSVTERTREIGLRMSIGGRGVDILLQFLTESIMISLTGGLIGVGLGVASTALVGNLLGWPTIVTQGSIILAFIVCAATGIFFGWYPAKKAAGLDPIEALRYE
jgi:putative ABC transport system permease protein